MFFPADPDPDDRGVGLRGAAEDGITALGDAVVGTVADDVEPDGPDVSVVPAPSDGEPVIPLVGVDGVVTDGADRPIDPVEVAAAVGSGESTPEGAMAAVPDVVEVHPANSNAAATRAAERLLVDQWVARWVAGRRIGASSRMIGWVAGDAPARRYRLRIIHIENAAS